MTHRRRHHNHRHNHGNNNQGLRSARYGRRLHRFIALRLRGDAATAEDLMVQTLVDAARNIRRVFTSMPAGAETTTTAVSAPPIAPIAPPTKSG